MPKRTVKHKTISLKRQLKAPPDRVFAALADPEARDVWAVPGEGWLHRTEASDFRIGGRDAHRFGPQDDPRYRAESTYLCIVPSYRIVMAGPVYDGDDMVSC